MQKLLDAKFIESATEEAIAVIMEDRARYNKYYDAIEKYIVDNNLILSNPLQLIEKPSKIVKEYIIYCVDPNIHAKNIADTLGKIGRWCKMRMVTPTEFLIEYDTRPLVTLYQIQKKRNVTLDVLINPQGLLMPPEIELIDIYNKLYNIAEFDKIAENREIEKQLFALMNSRLKILGGSECLDMKRTEVEHLKSAIIMDWLPNFTDKQCVIIGKWAANIYSKGTDMEIPKDKIQLIIDYDIAVFANQLELYLENLTQFQMTYREQHLYIPKDFRTIRYTFYIQLPIKGTIMEKAFMDVFNCGSFEIIPVVKHGNLYLGSPWVMCRFLTIDLWVMRLIEHIGSISPTVLHEFVTSTYKTLCDMRKLVDTTAVTDFIGVYHDYNIDKKIRTASIQSNAKLEAESYYPRGL